MNLTDLWYELVDMTKSDAPLFVINDRKITERQFVWIMGLFLAILVLIAIKNLAMWVVGGSAKKVARAVAPIKRSKKKKEKKAVEEKKEEKKPESEEDRAKSPKDLLENTSEKRRTLYDYVTPDSVHADIVKQTLNKDYPYQTLKPDKAKINVTSNQSSSAAIKQEETISKIEFAEVPKNEPVLRNAPTVGISSIKKNAQEKTQSESESNKLTGQPNQQMNSNAPNTNSDNTTLPPLQNNSAVPVTNNQTTNLPQQESNNAAQLNEVKPNIQPEIMEQSSKAQEGMIQQEKVQQIPSVQADSGTKQQVSAVPVSKPPANQQPLSSQAAQSNIKQKETTIAQNPQPAMSETAPTISTENKTAPVATASPQPTATPPENNAQAPQNLNTTGTPQPKKEIDSVQVPPKQQSQADTPQQIFNPADPLLP